MSALLVLTTVGADADAAALARALVESRVAACVNVIDRVRSTYRWEGTIHEDSEQLLLIKTTVDRLEALRDELFARHPYEVPEFVVVNATTSEAYGAWLAESVR